MSWKLHYLVLVSSFVLAIVLIGKLLRERRAPGSTLAWLLFMVIAPYVGVPLFLILGNRKLKRARRLKGGLYNPIPSNAVPQKALPTERLLLASGAPQKSTDNQVELLETGESAYRALVELLEGARQTIHVTTFILKLDPVGKTILALLEEKARAGVQVRLLLDGLGSFWTFKWRLRGFRRSGGKIAYFLPLIHIPFFGHSNLRNHRKLVVADGTTALIGGMNLSSEYMGPTAEPKRWVDLSLRVRGTAVADLEKVFAADWSFASGEREVALNGTPRGAAGTESLQVVAGGPDVLNDPLYDSIVSAIFDAKERIWIATPYYIPDETLSKALELAAKRGVDVRVLVPKRSNHVVADMCRGGYLRLLQNAGGKVFFYPKMIHAKALLVDRLYAVLGSANLDMRSLLLNYELGLFIYSEGGLQEVSHWFERRFAQAYQEPIPTFMGSGVVEGVGRLLGPVL